MERAQIEKKLWEVIVSYFGDEVAKVDPKDRMQLGLYSVLNVDELDLEEIRQKTEDGLDITFTDLETDAWATVADIAVSIEKIFQKKGA